MADDYKIFTIKLRVPVGSIENKMLQFFNTKSALPFDKSQMILVALKAFWLPLVFKNSKTLADSVYLWNLQEHYLKQQLGIQAEDADFKPSQSSESSQPQQPIFNPFGMTKD
jgi:hypothetical protein